MATWLKYFMARLLLLLVIWVAIAPVLAANAAESEDYSNAAVTARLISAEDGVSPDAASVSLGLVLEYGDGWKGYWRTPGEVGLAPEIDWTGSSNLKSAETLWPAPERFEAFGIENFGYSGEVVLPIRAMLKDRGKPAELRARIALLTCSDICVPHNFEIALSLQRSVGIDAPSAARIAKFVAEVPLPPAESDIEIGVTAIDERATALFVTAKSKRPFQVVDVFSEFGPQVTFGKPDIRLNPDRTELWAKVPLNAWSEEHDAPSITLTDTGRAITAPVSPGTEISAPPHSGPAASGNMFKLFAIATIAILGGAILNVMPCVLPVLSIKFASVLKATGQSRRVLRNGFLFSALGVLTFVWLLAGLVLLLKWVGVSVGWGIQFQNPVFVALMLLVVFVFAANLFGAFEITLPAAIQNRLGSASHRAGYAADFGTGLLAAVLATPCSAPFLGTAITFALAGSAVDVLVVFTALGIGLASPYILISAQPALIERLPRPGRWMLVVRLALGGLLLATTAWLFFVLVSVAGWPVATLTIAAAAVLVLLAMTKWLNAPSRYALMPASLALVLVGAAFLSAPTRPEISTEATFWHKFVPADIARHVSQGETVFVDVTADWCLTCNVNKTLVLNRGRVFERLSDGSVIAMQADWTRPDIAAVTFEKSRRQPE